MYIFLQRQVGLISEPSATAEDQVSATATEDLVGVTKIRGSFAVFGHFGSGPGIPKPSNLAANNPAEQSLNSYCMTCRKTLV